MTWHSPALLALLAQVPAPSSGVTPELQDAIRTIIVIMVLGAIPVIIGCINGVLAIFDRFKAKPPLHKEYATKAELAGLEARINTSLKSVAENMSEVKEDWDKYVDKSDRHRDGIANELKSIASQMGEIYGRLGCGPVPKQRRG